MPTRSNRPNDIGTFSMIGSGGYLGGGALFRLGAGQGRHSQAGVVSIEVLDDAKDDLVDRFHFYEEQSPGLGSTFWTPSSPTSIRCCFTPVFIASSMALIGLSPVASLLRFTTEWRTRLFVSGPSSTAAAIPHGFGVGLSAPSLALQRPV